MNFWIVCVVIVSMLLCQLVSSERLTESQRVKQWKERHSEWPFFRPEHSEKFRETMKNRDKMLQLLPGSRERWENYMQFTQSLITPRFTPQGFKLLKTPPRVHEILSKQLNAALADWDNMPYEKQANAIATPLLPKMSPVVDTKEIYDLMLPVLEEWSGLKLKPTSLYGIRAYQNGSSLAMHYDRVETHVISAIIHIDHEYDDEENPWPIEIEDHDGQIHAYNLKAGETLLYESSSCLHGRRSVFRGKHYSSIFIHYMPVEDWKITVNDVINSVTPTWNDNTVEAQGNRWQGQALTTDDLISANAPPRIINGVEVPDLAAFYADYFASNEL